MIVVCTSWFADYDDPDNGNEGDHDGHDYGDGSGRGGAGSGGGVEMKDWVSGSQLVSRILFFGRVLCKMCSTF